MLAVCKVEKTTVINSCASGKSGSQDKVVYWVECIIGVQFIDKKWVTSRLSLLEKIGWEKRLHQAVLLINGLQISSRTAFAGP